MKEIIEKQNTTEEKGRDATPMSMIDKANLAALRLEEANKRHEELLAREEAMQVRKALGGESDAGQGVAQKLDETPQEYAKRIMRGELND